MILISHRGNLVGKTPARENSPDYILEALYEGYNVEIDVWYIDDRWMLGHDEPQYEINASFLKDNRLWCHAKNIEALSMMRREDQIRYFWHQDDDVTLTSDNYLWVYPGKQLVDGSICVLPERTNLTPDMLDLRNYRIEGICSDIISFYM